MIDHNVNEDFRQIEDIIDARKLLGQYNISKQSNGMNFRYIYSSSTGNPPNKSFNLDDVFYDRDTTSNLRTDSEITIVRVRCEETIPKSFQNTWDMHDIAVPGDGSHLGESPSLVNLATLVGRNIPCEGEEYLVPLSSWDPFLKTEDLHFDSDLKCCSDAFFRGGACSKNIKLEPSNSNSTANDTSGSEVNIRNEEGIDLVFRRRSWAGKISKFIRKHCRKSKTLTDENVNKN